MTITAQSFKEVRPKPPKVRHEYPGISRPMTYEEYLASPEEMARYDILDGWKVYRLYGEQDMPNPSKAHQEILLEIANAFRDYRRRTRQGKVFLAPCDVLITERPFRCRQTDVLYTSAQRLSQNESATDSSPLSPAPELVVEIVSPSERPSMIDAKIADYRAVGVREVWLVFSQTREIRVLRLTIDEIRVVATYGAGEAVTSVTFPDLAVTVDDIFAE